MSLPPDMFSVQRCFNSVVQNITRKLTQITGSGCCNELSISKLHNINMVHISCRVSHAISKTAFLSGTYSWEPFADVYRSGLEAQLKRMPLRGGPFGFREDERLFFGLIFNPFTHQKYFSRDMFTQDIFLPAWIFQVHNYFSKTMLIDIYIRSATFVEFFFF